jgi:carbonic anhydrase
MRGRLFALANMMHRDLPGERSEMVDPKRGFVVIAATIAMAAPRTVHAEDEHHWSYRGSTGPAEWAALETEYTACGLGKAQSPIDIRDADAKKSDLSPIAFDYKPSPLRIIDNGHTVQVDYAPGSSISVQGKRYDLVQFHFHRPSEEKIDGKSADMVAHLVHKDRDGNLAVVAVLLKAGGSSRLIDTLWKNVPKAKGEERVVPGVEVNAADLLPANKAAYYTFTGSLTTPPCSEGVTWFVLKTPASISQDEVVRFAHLYPMNARPTQPVNGREIRVTR